MMESKKSEKGAEKAAQKAHQCARKSKDARNAFKRGSHRLENGDFPLLVVDEQNKQGNDVAASDEKNDGGNEGEKGSIAPKLLQEVFRKFIVFKGSNCPIVG